MNKRTISLLLFNCLIWALMAGTQQQKAENYPQILDISCTPKESKEKTSGLFTDAGSWIGFTNPSSTDFVNGFCGPYSLAESNWISKSIAIVGVRKNKRVIEASQFKQDSVNYSPGKLYMSSSFEDLKIEQKLVFVDKNHALLQLNAENVLWEIRSKLWSSSSIKLEGKNSLIIELSNGDLLTLTFTENFILNVTENGYTAKSEKPSNRAHILISCYNNQKEKDLALKLRQNILENPLKHINQSKQRWDCYLSKVLRKDMPQDYNRIAVKSVVTLLSNWRSAKDDILHEGLMPSHTFFMGFWSWDSWKHAYALARFAPELAKNQVRAMFDYQLENGMIVDCIYLNKKKNNLRNTKSPLAAWAVLEIYNQTKDKKFLKEMFPKLVKYNSWWYIDRDNNKNGICEFGCTDGTPLAARWEGVDNAIRFDNIQILRNNQNAWSMNQESVDLNSYLFHENTILREIASILKVPYNKNVDGQKLDNYFFDTTNGYYYDRKFNGDLIKMEGCEGFIPMWVKMASKEKAKQVVLMYEKPTKFSTYIPFPTVSVDNPGYIYNGYWRGPIWLDQVYFGISGMRNYGYKQQADNYTKQVFDRLNGLKKSAPIHENYDPKTGERLRAPHFSWSAAHLLMLYWEFGK